jgi:hypothetical protein
MSMVSLKREPGAVVADAGHWRNCMSKDPCIRTRASKLPDYSVILYSDLCLATIANRRQGRDRQGQLWHILLWLDAPGQGFISLSGVKKASRLIKLSPRSLRRIISGGAGFFWRVAPKGLNLRSAANVAMTLGVAAFRALIRRPISDLLESLSRVRARLAVFAVAAIRRGRPTSVAVMSQILHTSERTAQAWRRGGESAGIDAACRGAISATRCGDYDHHDHDHQDGAVREGAFD